MKRAAEILAWLLVGGAIVAHYTADALTGTFLIALLLLLLFERAGWFDVRK